MRHKDFKPYRSALVMRARELRRDETEAERALWARVRGRRLGGFKFYRQAVREGYILDFYCRDADLVVEVDGAVHDSPTQRAKDDLRTQVLESKGYTVIRFTNEQVLLNTDDVCRQILDVIHERLSSTPSHP